MQKQAITKLQAVLLNPQFLLPLLVFICAVFTAPYNFDFHHSGLMLQTAFDVLDGKLIFKETYSQYGFTTPFMHALTFLLLGKNYLSIQYFTALNYVLISWLCIKIWSKLGLSKLDLYLAGFLFFISQSYLYFEMLSWPSVYAITTQLLALFFGLHFVDKQKLHFLILAGFLSALTFTIRWPVGFLTMLSFYIWFALEKKEIFKRSLSFSAGILLCLAPIYIYLSLNSSLGDLTQQMFSIPLTWAAQDRTNHLFTPLVNLFPIFTMKTLSVWSCFAAVLLYGAYYIQGKSEDSYSNLKKQLTFCILAIALIYFSFGANILRHQFYWTIIPIINLIYVLNYFFKRYLYKKAVRPESLLILILMTSMWAQYHPVPETRHFFWSSVLMFGLTGKFLKDTVKQSLLFFRYHAFGLHYQSRSILLIPLCLYLVISTLSLTQKSVKAIYLHTISDKKNYQSLKHPSYLRGVKIPKKQIPPHLERLEVIRSTSKNKTVMTMYKDLGYNLYRKNDFPGPAFPEWKEVNLFYPERFEAQLNFAKERKAVILTDNSKTEMEIRKKLPCYKKTLEQGSLIKLENFCE